MYDCIENEFKVFQKENKISFCDLQNKTILITGALGMLSSYIIELVRFLNNDGYNIKLVLLARSRERLSKRYPFDKYKAEFIISDMSDSLYYEGDVDYILHFAGNSSPYHIKRNPLDIIRTNVNGSLNIVDFAKKKNVTKVLFSSTREVYGEVKVTNGRIKEEQFGVFNPLDARSCYPESKRMAENVFKSAYIQHGLNFNILRIAHSYGPGMLLSDGRVMADFIGHAINKEDIKLLSDGEALRSFCYIADAVFAILLVLIKGHPGEAFNIANESEEIKIYELANKLSSMVGGIKVTRVAPNKDSVYCAYERVGLCTKKIENLGWKPIFDLDYGIKSTLDSFKK